MSIFVGHSGSDTAFACGVSVCLDSLGVPNWIAEKDIRHELGLGIAEGIENCEILLAVMSKKFDSCSWCMDELSMAYTLGKTIFAVKVEDYLPLKIAGLHLSRKFQYFEVEHDKFMILIERLLRDLLHQAGYDDDDDASHEGSGACASDKSGTKRLTSSGSLKRSSTAPSKASVSKKTKPDHGKKTSDSRHQLMIFQTEFLKISTRNMSDLPSIQMGLEKLSLLKEKSVMNAILCEPLNGIPQVKMRTGDGYDVNRVMLNSKTCVPVIDLDTSQHCVKELMPEVNSVPKVRKIRDGSGDRGGTGLVNKLEREVQQLQHEKESLENTVEVLQREAKSQQQSGKQKMSEDTRKKTDVLGSSVMRCLGEMQEELQRRCHSVDLTEESMPEESMPDLDDLFEDYGNAIDAEIKLANQGESLNDVAVIQRALIAVTSELRRKLENVRQLIKLRARFLDECEDLKKWLNKSPDISRLQATAKTIRALKSKLRYRLADLQDMKEDGRENSEEFLSVEIDLEEIRGQLQKQLEIEDEQLKWLSVLTLNHFPEMIVQHPELNLQKFIKFGGLLKSGHMLDQFQLKPLPGCTKKYVHKSTYCGKPVILKEFFVGLQSDASESHFLKNVRKYSELMSPHLAQLVSVFFGMNDRQAVVVLPCFEFNLTQLMEDVAIWLTSDKAKVLGSVLQGISALHGMELIHGAIHPNNILVNKSSGDVVVADYDFTKTPAQRSENPFVTSSGLTFQAPELSLAGCQPSYLSDMYNFGLLILWIHSPQITSVPSSLPELSSKIPDGDTARLVAFLLEKQPERRPATDQILAVGYFTPDEPEEESFATETKEEASLPSEGDDTGTSVDVRGVETEAQLIEGLEKDATEECKAEKSSTEEEGLPESTEEPKAQSEESNSVTAYDLKEDTCAAECVESKIDDSFRGQLQRCLKRLTTEFGRLYRSPAL